MQNLFNYATKELSQDAFLRWFLDSDIDDSGKQLLAAFTDIDYRKISDIKTYAQVENIDICVDFKVDGVDHILIIEDKVESNEHDNQLQRYMEIIAEWNKGNHAKRPSHFIYYKPRKLSDVEEKAIKKAKISKRKWQWRSFDINHVYYFFQQYLKHGNIIIQQYAEYISNIFHSYKEVSTDPLSEWSELNWKTFFNQLMEKHQFNIWHNTLSFRGTYISLLASMEIKNNKYLLEATFEIQVRGSLIPYLHPVFYRHKKDSGSWSINVFEGNKNYDAAKQELLDLRGFVESQKSQTIKRGNTARAFAKIDEHIDYKEMNANQLESKLVEWIDEFKKIINLYNSR